MARVDSTYPVKVSPELTDSFWGLDNTIGKNRLFSIPGLLSLMEGVDPTAVNVKLYPGVLGDGENDDTVGIQLALDEAAGRWVHFPPGDYFITEPLVFPENTRIKAYGARIFNDESHFYLIEANNNTIIKGMEIEGAGAETPDIEGRGISIVGTVGEYKSNITLEDVYVHDVGFYGVYLQFVENFEIKTSRVHNVGYGGIMGLSVTKGNVDTCWVKGITGVTNGYNISLTRETAVNTLEANPRSKDITVENCLAEDNEIWKGLDTHGGDNIRFINCVVRNCKQGIGIVSSGPDVTGFAAKSCTAEGNFIYGIGEDYGITVGGVLGEDTSESGDDAENCSVVGNWIFDSGISGNNNYGAIRFVNTRNLKIRGNIIIRPVPHGIAGISTNFNFSITDNLIVDAHDSVITAPSGIVIRSVFNTGFISGNYTVKQDAGIDTYVGLRGITISTEDDNFISTKGNFSNCDTHEVIPASVNLERDYFYNTPLTFTNAQDAIVSQMIFNGTQQIRTSNTLGLHDTEKRALLFSSPENSTVFFNAFTGSMEWFSINAKTIDLIGKTRIANLSTLEATGTTLSADGTAGSGSVFKNGIHYTIISAGLTNNYPSQSGMSRVYKAPGTEGSYRLYEEFSNTTGDLWYRCLDPVEDNEWHKVITSTFITEAYEQTTDPLVAGRIWNNAGVLTFSNG